MTNCSEECCEWPRCKRERAMLYLGKRLCDYHWENFVASEDEEVSKKAEKTLGIDRKKENE